MIKKFAYLGNKETCMRAKRVLKYLRLNILFLTFVILTSFTISHKFYVSVTQLTYSSKDNSIQITSRIFIDDLEKVLVDRYGIDTYLATERQIPKAEDWINRYLSAKLNLTIDGAKVPMEYIGSKYEDDIIVCFLEVEGFDLSAVKRVEFENLLLFDTYDDQQNITHLEFGDIKKSYVFNSDNNKGMLNF